MKIKCESCGKTLVVPDNYLDKLVRCPACKHRQKVTAQETQPESIEFDPMEVLATANESEKPATTPDPNPQQHEMTQTVLPSRQDIRRAYPAPSTKTISTPNYTALKIVSILFNATGIVIGLLGILGTIVIILRRGRVFYFSAMGDVRDLTIGDAVSMALPVLLYTLMSALVSVAIGQAISAFRDIAINTWSLRKM